FLRNRSLSPPSWNFALIVVECRTPNVARFKSVFPGPRLRCRCDPSLRKDGRALALEVRVMANSGSNRVAPKILIADDDPCVLRAVADRCTRMGFDVETATNGLKALIKASQHRPDVL